MTHRPLVLDDVDPRAEVSGTKVVREVVQKVDSNAAPLNESAHGHRLPFTNHGAVPEACRHDRVRREEPLPDSKADKNDTTAHKHGNDGSLRISEAQKRERTVLPVVLDPSVESQRQQKQRNTKAEKQEAKRIDHLDVVKDHLQRRALASASELLSAGVLRCTERKG